MLDLLRSARAERLQRVSLSDCARKDLKWWLTFASSWNGVGLMMSTDWSDGPVLFCDASKAGIGGWFPAERRWLVASRPSTVGGHDTLSHDASMRSTLVELFGCLVVVTTWAPLLRGRNVTVRCDNTGACAIADSGTSASPPLMDVWRSILAVAAAHNFCVRVVHIAGADNIEADALSRQDVPKFRAAQPSARPLPCPTPPVCLTEW